MGGRLPWFVLLLVGLMLLRTLLPIALRPRTRPLAPAADAIAALGSGSARDVRAGTQGARWPGWRRCCWRRARRGLAVRGR